MSAMDMPADGRSPRGRAGQGAGDGLDLLGRPGHDDHELGRQPAGGADDGGLRARLRVPLHRARDRLPAADLAGLGGARVRATRAASTTGSRRGISKPMGFLAVWCQFAMTIFYYPSLLGFVASTLAYVINPELASSGVWTACVIVVVYWTGVWVSSRGTSGVAGLASIGLVIGTLIPGAVLVILGVVFLGQGNESAAPMDAAPPAAGLGRTRQPRADRQQLPVLLRHGDERRARRVAEEPRQGVPEGDVPGHGAGAADLHPARAGDQLGGPGRGAVAHRRRDAGLRRGVRAVRHPVADADLRDHAGRRVARRHAHLARRAVEGPAADLARRRATCRRSCRR